MGKVLARFFRLGLVAMAMSVGGCSSCQESPELPSPIPQEGRLPPAPAPVITRTLPAQVYTPTCAVVASASVEEGVAPLEVQFTGEGMCSEAPGKFEWDFGDGSEPMRDQNPRHTYQAAGTYTARVTISDPEHDAKDTDEIPIAVTAP